MNATYAISVELKRLLKAAIPAAQDRERFEDGLRAVAGVVGEQNFGWMDTRIELFLQRIILGEERYSIGLSLPTECGSEHVVSAVESYVQTDDKTRAYWIRIAEHPVRAHACLVALFAVLRLALPTDEVGLLPFIRRYLSEIQADMISVRARNCGKSVLFFQAEPGHHSHFGSVPDLIEAEGMESFRVYAYLDEQLLRSHTNAYYFEFGASLEQLSDITLFVLPTSCENTPPNAMRMLIDKVTVCEFEPDMTWVHVQNAMEKDVPPPDPRLLREKYAPREQLFPIYDMVVVSSRTNLEDQLQLARFYGYSRVQNGKREEAELQACGDGARLMTLLLGKRVCHDVKLVLAGSQKLSVIQTAVARIRTIPEMIAFCPIGLAPDPTGEFWYPKMAIHDQCAEVLEQLLKTFPERTVIFRPHMLMSEQVVNQIMTRCGHYDNLLFQDAGDDESRLFSKSALLVTDFAADAFLFAFSTLRPVVFYSRNEALVQRVLGRMEPHNYLKLREEIGAVATSPDELDTMIKRLLLDTSSFEQSIRVLREQEMLRHADGASHIARSILAAVQEQSLDEWIQLKAIF